MGQVVHEEPEDGAEVVLRSGHRHLDGNRSLRVAVAAGGEEKLESMLGEEEGGGGGWRGKEDVEDGGDLQSLDA